MCRRKNVESLSLRPYGCGLPQSFHDFVALCLIKDPNTRPSAKQLMQHAFIKQRQVPTSAPGLPGSPLPHLHWGSPPPHVHRDGAHPAPPTPGQDWARPFHVCTGTSGCRWRTIGRGWKELSHEGPA